MLVLGILMPGQETAPWAETLFFLSQLPFDPQDCVMLTGCSSSIVCVPKSSPVEIACWGATQGRACFQLGGEREVCVAVGLSSKFEVELRIF